MAAALPGRLLVRLMRSGLAALLALAFLLIDLPVTLHAAAWDTLAFSLKVTDFSPLLSWYQFSLSQLVGRQAGDRGADRDGDVEAKRRAHRMNPAAS